MELLGDPAHELRSTDLMELSGLMDEDLRLFSRTWPGVPAPRRQEVLARLNELAEDNVEMDFFAIYRHALTDPDAGVRQRAVAGLWESDDRTLIAPLLTRLREDAEPGVRAAAALVLGHFALLAQAGKLIPRDGQRIYEGLLGTLQAQDEPVAVRRRALEAVSVFAGEDVRRWVRWGYESDQPFLRQSAVHAMGRSCDAVWLPTLLMEMDSPDPAMRFEAASAAREMGEEDALERLVELAQDDLDTQVRLAAVEAIGAIGGSRAVRALKRFMASDDEALAEAATEAMSISDLDAGDFSLMRMDPRQLLEGLEDGPRE
jgi:HEAT repeat protein